MKIKISGINKNYGEKKILKDIHLDIQSGDFFFLLGPSGCGKTTLLRLLAGLEEPNSGKIYFDEDDITPLAANQRKISMVFQNYALWPHMTVWENLEFGLKIKKMNSNHIKDKINEILKIVRLEGYEERYPNQLSGGQQQRVALARAIVVEPKLLLLDEPLSNLDASLRNEMRIELRRIQKKTKITAIYVTHDQKEALTMADEMAVLKDGIVEQKGDPHHIYYHPDNRFIAGFIGEANFFDASLLNTEHDLIYFHTPFGKMTALPPRHGKTGSNEWTLSIRPSLIEINNAHTGNHQKENTFTAKVIDSIFLGSTQEYHLKCNDIHLYSVQKSVMGKPVFHHGDLVSVSFPKEYIMSFPKGTES